MKSLNGGSVIKCDEIVDTPETVSIGSINKKNNQLSYFSHFFISITFLLLLFLFIIVAINCYEIKRRLKQKAKLTN